MKNSRVRLGSVGKSIDLPTRHLSKLKDGFRHPTCPLSEADPLVSGPGWKSGGRFWPAPASFAHYIVQANYSIYSYTRVVIKNYRHNNLLMGNIS